MVDVDRRMEGLSPGHAAGLRRLSARAATASTSSSIASSPASVSSHRQGLLSFRPLAESVLAHLRACSVPLNHGLSNAEFAHLEAELSFSFPPDLRAVLALGVPAGSGFPDWRSLPRLRADFELPIAAAALQVARGSLWPRSWGPRPADSDRALRLARAALRRAPLLVPVFDRCYIPASAPSLAGNPVFSIDDACILCCGFDLADFFQREESSFLHFNPQPSPDSPSISALDNSHRKHNLSALPPSTTRRSIDAIPGRTARWIELWSDAASDRRRRISSSSSDTASSPPSPRPDPEQFVEIRTPRLPDWVGSYLDKIGTFLQQGGWREADVTEMVHASAVSSLFYCYYDGAPPASAAVSLDAEAVLDSLLVKADRCSDSLRRAGWRSEEVSDGLGFDIFIESRRRRVRQRHPPVKLPPEFAKKIEKLAETVARDR